MNYKFYGENSALFLQYLTATAVVSYKLSQKKETDASFRVFINGRDSTDAFEFYAISLQNEVMNCQIFVETLSEQTTELYEIVIKGIGMLLHRSGLVPREAVFFAIYKNGLFLVLNSQGEVVKCISGGEKQPVEFREELDEFYAQIV
ncbi:hypothetical protein ECANGB1_457 [Enterospora canceri]|uniref:Uncharacterized protein n=1 Tax=Enterospora canceri TaxID=1081671 RepID=A0A1Y1S818_9MICR|nr:hypothetical protein ECANGB1_457 [Enterospora canceri]